MMVSSLVPLSFRVTHTWASDMAPPQGIPKALYWKRTNIPISATAGRQASDCARLCAPAASLLMWIGVSFLMTCGDQGVERDVPIPTDEYKHEHEHHMRKTHTSART